jgi:hypothetical protein
MEELVVRPFHRLAATAAAFAVLAVGQPALAWGDLGHRVVADLAYERLTPTARSQVDALLKESAVSGEPSCPVASLADAAVFPDCVDGIRRYNDWRKVHYDEVPFCPEPRADYCKDGECASGAAKQAVAVLGDPAQPPATRLMALEQLSHVLADLHQPLDMIDNRDDRGEEIRITLPGSSDRRLNLHQFWNDIVLAPALGGEQVGVRYLEPLARSGRGWDVGDIDGWARETAALAHRIYIRLPEPPMCRRNPKNPEMLDRGYVLSAVATAREQLAKAGIRLATVLNATLR